MKNKTFWYGILIIAISSLLSLNKIKLFTLDDLGLFLTVIGLIYGLIAAFTISNSWERFSKIRDEIAAETSALENFYLLGKSLPDRITFKNIRKMLASYLIEVPAIEWKDYWKSENIHKKFRNLIEEFSKIEISGEKFIVIFDDMGDELKRASAARSSQLVLSQTRLTRIQWVLNLFLSISLIISITLLKFNDPIVSIFIVAVMIIAILMILLVIYELDSMIIAEQEVSIEPYLKLASIIKKDK